MIGLSLPSAAHPSVFQHALVRPSAPCHRGFGLAADRSPSFGSAPADLDALFALAFASAPAWPWPCRRGQLADSLCKRHAVTRLRGLLQLEGAWFQVLFLSPRGVLFTFPSRYSFAIGRWLVFSLGGWALRIRTGFHVSRPTWDPCSGRGGFAHGAVTLCGATFQTLALAPSASCAGPATPGGWPPGLGLVRVRSPLLAESIFLSFPPATEMFHFAGSRARRAIWFTRGRHPGGCRVAPFGNPRIEDRMRLPGAYRSLPRPSSPATAKASAMRPYSLDA